jgi:hypothetical protein
MKLDTAAYHSTVMSEVIRLTYRYQMSAPTITPSDQIHRSCEPRLGYVMPRMIKVLFPETSAVPNPPA